MGNIKEKIMMIAIIIGIGAISLGITLAVYNVRISNTDNVKESQFVKNSFNGNLTEEQKLVAQNIINELEKIEASKINENKDERLNEDINDNIEKQLEHKKTTDNEEEKNNKQENNVEQSDENMRYNAERKNNNTINETPSEIEEIKIMKENANEKELIENSEYDVEKIVEVIANVDKNIEFIKPIDSNDIGMGFSDEKLIYSQTLDEWLTHKGIDYLASVGTEVYASEAGKIKEMYDDKKIGFTITIEHDNDFISKYSGIEKNKDLKIGQEIARGEVISKISKASGFEKNEGSHLHFEILKDGINIEPKFN